MVPNPLNSPPFSIGANHPHAHSFSSSRALFFTTMSIPLINGLAHQLVDHVMEDLLVRFLVNCPDEDLSSIERVFFQVEEAQWFYTDFLKQLNPKLPPMKMKQFAGKFLEKAPLIWKWGDPGDALGRFGRYKLTIPVRGVACFNEDFSKVLLVKGTDSHLWSFPRGKISKGESDMDCAVREGEEEIGYNVRDHICENDVVERNIRGKNYKIYMALNVPEDFPFAPKARNEISQIKWFDVKLLARKVKQQPNQYFIVETMIKPLLKWVNIQKGTAQDLDKMYAAEQALKELLGLTLPALQAPKADLDAGRELLNILQKQPAIDAQSQQQQQQQAPTLVPPQQPMIHIPHYVYQPVQQYLPSPMQFPPMPFPGQVAHQGPPGMMAPPNHGQGLPAGPDVAAPNPNLFNKPQMELKELLLILNSSNKPAKSPRATPVAPTLVLASNRSKANELLLLFKKPTASPDLATASPVVLARLELPLVPLVAATGSRRAESPGGDLLSILHRKQKPQSPSPLPHTPQFQPSNLLEQSLTSSVQPQPKKVTILKRSSDNKNANDLLSLLKPKEKQPEPELVPEASASSVPSVSTAPSVLASQDLLGLLHQKPPAQSQTPVDSLTKPQPKSQLKSPSQNPASQELLGMLKPKTETAPLAAQDLLGMLKPTATTAPVQTKPVQPVAQPVAQPLAPPKQPGDGQFEDFEDFEDFDDFSDINNQFTKSFHNFDIESDEEDVDHLLDQQNNKPIDFFKQPSPASDEQPVRGKIRLLKPGERLDDIKPPQPLAKPLMPSAGQELLALLNGGTTSAATDAAPGNKPAPQANADFFQNLLNRQD